MTAPTIPPEYEALKSRDLTNIPVQEALDHLGLLIDAAHEQRDNDGTKQAIASAAALNTQTWTSTQRATLHFYLANANDDLRTAQETPEERWNWTSEAFDNSLLHLRQATNEPGFHQLIPELQCRILTNLGNHLSTIGRYIEAQEPWNHALRINPAHAMARANRGYGRFHYAKTLQDPGHREAFLHLAHEDLRASIERIPYPDAKAYFASIQEAIETIAPRKHWEEPHTFPAFSLGTKAETEYRTWALRHRLFLNPINDLTTETVAAADVIHTPDMVVPLGQEPIFQGLFNQLKQEYATARYLLYQGLHQKAPAWPDRDVLLLDTLDYPAYGTNLELVKLAYRSLYSLLDKIAYGLNTYLALGIHERRVTFRKLWHEREDTKRPLKPQFTRYPNLPLRGLYWISRDLDAQAERHLAPDADKLHQIRQHLEHKYLKAHTESINLVADTLAHNVLRDDLEGKAQRLAKIVRAALLYFILGITVEEQRRDEHRAGEIIPGTTLPSMRNTTER